MADAWEGEYGDVEGDPLDAYQRGLERSRSFNRKKLAYLNWLVAQPMCECGIRHIGKGPKCYSCLCMEMLPIYAHNLHTYGVIK